MSPMTTLARNAGCAALLAAASHALAQQAVSLPDGSEWRQQGASMVRIQPAPPLSATVDFYPLDINCASGMLLTNADRPGFLGAGYFPKTYVAQEADDSHAVVCTETLYQTLVVELGWQGSLSPAAAEAFRTLLPVFAAGAEKSAAAEAWAGPPPVVLFSSGPAVRMNAETGFWVDGGGANETTATLIKRWPLTEPVGIALQRGPETCVGVGAAADPPAWAPAGVYTHGARDGDLQYACADLPSGYIAVSMLDAHVGRDPAHVRAMLSAIAAALGARP
jgi:hypothetical protein